MTISRQSKITLIIVTLLFFVPVVDLVTPGSYRFGEPLQTIFIFAILGLGLNIVTGLTGLLNLGVAAFMAVGAYTYAILTCDIYPFQLPWYAGFLMAIVCGAVSGIALGLPTLRLRGDYLAIVTMGFGEIVQDSLKNLEGITKGTQGINPLPPPALPGIVFSQESYYPWYYLFLLILVGVIVICHNLENSRIGRAFISIREDELASRCMGINPVRTKLLAFATGAGLCSLAGALWACFLGSSGEPGNYDFQVSMIALCIVIVGGMGSIPGILVGALVMVGFNSIVLVKLTQYLSTSGILTSESVFTSPNNWKYSVFGLALIIMMRLRPQGLIPARAAASGVRT